MIVSSSHGPALGIQRRTAITMCIPAPIPSGWQRVCLKQQGRGLGHGESCSLFCSPNGKKFRTLEDVHRYNSELELRNLEKEKMSYSFLPAKHSTGGYQFVPTANQQKLMCNNCPEQFYNTSGLKKHEREKHSGNPSEDNVSCAQCKFEFSSAAEKLSHVWPGFSFAFFRFVFDSCLGSFTVIGSLPFSPFSWVFLNCANWPGFLGEELRGLSVLASLH